MRTANSKWPIVPPDSRMITMTDLQVRLRVNNSTNLRKWIIKQGFEFVLARLGEGNQLCLCVTPDVWREIAERRRELGYRV